MSLYLQCERPNTMITLYQAVHTTDIVVNVIIVTQKH